MTIYHESYLFDATTNRILTGKKNKAFAYVLEKVMTEIKGNTFVGYDKKSFFLFYVSSILDRIFTRTKILIKMLRIRYNTCDSYGESR